MKDIVLLDGGMGQELIARAKNEPTPLWSAQVMLDEPDLVRQIHLDYIRAGARLITVNTYSATRCRLGPAGLEDKFEMLQHKACELAMQARDESGEDVKIAGCLPPFKWSYRYQEVDPAEQTAEQYREIAALQANYVDVLLCETMASSEQSLGAAMGACGHGKPVWMAWTLDDHGTGKVRSGDSLAESYARLGEFEVEAVLINCSIPEAIDAGIDPLSRLKLPFGAYANGFTGIPDDFQKGTTVEMLSARGDVSPESYARFVLDWAKRGACILGGCCEIGPAHIKYLADQLVAANYTISGALKKEDQNNA